MNARWLLSALAAVGFVAGFASVSFTGCGGNDCRVGSESCDCTAGGACDPGLSCASKRCVRLAGGAGGTTGGDGGTSTPPAFDPTKACDDFGKTVCERLDTCAPAAIKLAYGDVKTCTDREKLDCLDGARAMDTGFTQAAVDGCLSAAKTASCVDLLYRLVPACEIKGKRGDGQICGTDEQCTSAYCKTNSASMCGTCGGHVGAGSACREDDECAPGFICSADSHCVKPGEGGTACSANQPCKFGFYCRQGSCVQQAQKGGDTCQDQDGCNLLNGLFCNTSVGKCQTLGFAKAGEPCGLVNSTLTLCTAKSSCQIPQGRTQGICSSTASDGAACSDTAPCLDPARCVNGNCRLPNSASCN